MLSKCRDGANPSLLVVCDAGEVEAAFLSHPITCHLRPMKTSRVS